MLARKCDRCGFFYDPEYETIDGKDVNAIRTLDVEINEKCWEEKKYDLCPECLKELKAWLEYKQEETK